MTQASSFKVTWTFVLLGSLLAGCARAQADDAAWAIYVMRPNGKDVRKVVRDEAFRAHGSPRWSHDDKHLAFDASGGPNGARKFFVVNVDGSGLEQLGDHATPDWSVDDKQLLYLSFGGATRAGTWVQNRDGQGRTWLVDGICAHWSPDGGRIVYMDTPEKRLMTYDLVQAEEKEFYDAGYERIEPGFDFAPDGKRLAVIGVNNTQGQRDLIIVGADGKGALRLREPKLEGPVAWSPDGKQLVVAIAHVLCVLDVDGAAPPRPIAGQVGRNSDPDWSHDGKWIAFGSDRP